MNIKKYLLSVIALLTIGLFATAIPVLAQSTTANSANPSAPHMQWGRPGGPNANGNHNGWATTTRPLMMHKNREGSTTPPFAGNGEPVVAGKVTSVNGTTLAITNASNVSYTVDTSNAKIVKGGTTGTATVANINIGDNVVVQGTVSGTSVIASSVIDGAPYANGPPTASTTPKQHVGFFGSIGNFFSHLFGF